MIPELHPTTFSSNFDSEPLGYLADTISCYLTEDLSGNADLVLTYPSSGIWAKELKSGNVVIIKKPARRINSVATSASDENMNIQQVNDAYFISRCEVKDDMMTVTCHHISYWLTGAINDGYDASNATNKKLNNVMYRLWTQANPSAYSGYLPRTMSYFVLPYLQNNTGEFGSTATKSLRSFLIDTWHSVQTVFNVEVVFRDTHAWVMTHLGKDDGVEVRLGKNISTRQYVKDEDGTFNAIVPYWVQNDTKIVANPPLVQPTTPITPIKAVAKDLTDIFQVQPTQAELETYARALLDDNKPWEPLETTHIEIRPEWNGRKYDLALGDTVSVYWSDIGAAREKMRVVRVTYDVLEEEYEKIELGDLQTGYVVTESW